MNQKTLTLNTESPLDAFNQGIDPRLTRQSLVDLESFSDSEGSWQALQVKISQFEFCADTNWMCRGRRARCSMIVIKGRNELDSNEAERERNCQIWVRHKSHVTELCLQPRGVVNLLLSSCLLIIYHLFMAILNPYHSKHVLEKKI